MKKIAVIHLGTDSATETITFLDQDVEITYAGCKGVEAEAQQLIQKFDGQVDAIALDGLPALLELGSARETHAIGHQLPALAQKTPVVDVRGIRDGLERWGVILADRAQQIGRAHV